MKVKVWNDNTHPYREKFRDINIDIPPKSYIVMDEDDAQTFKGTMSPNFSFEHRSDPKRFKMIRIESIGEAEQIKLPEVDKLRCYACAYKAANDADFTEHMTTHASQLVVDEEAERALKERRAQKKAS